MHSKLTGNKLKRFEEICECAAEVTDPEKHTGKRAVVRITFLDGFARDISLELTEKLAYQDEVK